MSVIEAVTKGRPKKFETQLTANEREALQQIAYLRSMPHGVVRRTQMILLSADGESNSAIARRFGVTVPTMAHWRKRFAAHGLVGIYGEQRSGRPRTHVDDRVASRLNQVFQQRPKHTTHWSVRSVATATGVAKSTVHRFFKLFGLQPHRQIIQAVKRSILCRKGARHRRTLPQPAGQDTGPLR